MSHPDLGSSWVSNLTFREGDRKICMAHPRRDGRRPATLVARVGGMTVKILAFLPLRLRALPPSFQLRCVAWFAGLPVGMGPLVSRLLSPWTVFNVFSFLPPLCASHPCLTSFVWPRAQLLQLTPRRVVFVILVQSRDARLNIVQRVSLAVHLLHKPNRQPSSRISGDLFCLVGVF